MKHLTTKARPKVRERPKEIHTQKRSRDNDFQAPHSTAKFQIKIPHVVVPILPVGSRIE